MSPSFGLDQCVCSTIYELFISYDREERVACFDREEETKCCEYGKQGLEFIRESTPWECKCY